MILFGIIDVGESVGQHLLSIALQHEIVASLIDGGVVTFLILEIEGFNGLVGVEQFLLHYVSGEDIGSIFECQTVQGGNMEIGAFGIDDFDVFQKIFPSFVIPADDSAVVLSFLLGIGQNIISNC